MSNIIKLRGYNFDQLSLYAEQLMDSLRSNRRVSQVELMDGNSWSLPNTEFHIRYNKEQIASGGLDIYDYYNTLHTMLYNQSLASVYSGNERQRVVMQSEGRDRYDRWYLENAQVDIDSVQMKLSTVGSIDKRRSDITINRSKQSYEMQVGFNFVGSYELCNRLIEKTIKTFNEEIMPLGFTTLKSSYSYGSDEKKTQIKLILLVIAMIYAMCAIIFESLRRPLVIIMIIPVSFIGVFLMFGLSGFRFDQGGFAAFVLLCGIVVNAGIYLITESMECSLTSRKKGLRLYLMAYNHKIVPISLTIISTILGLVPFLYDGPQEVFWFAFAVAAISGTAFSVVALLVYLPIFMPFDKRKSKENS
jgi:multidrug efflux pump subunit AcrB